MFELGSNVQAELAWNGAGGGGGGDGNGTVAGDEKVSGCTEKTCWLGAAFCSNTIGWFVMKMQ